MYYVGLDTHAKHVAMCVLTEVGKIYRRCQVRTIDEMMQILEKLPDRFEVCYEASCGYGHYHDLLWSFRLRPRSSQHGCCHARLWSMGIAGGRRPQAPERPPGRRRAG